MAKRNTMSTASAAKEWIVIVRDKPGSYSKRMEIRPKHLEGVRLLEQQGVITSGGGFAQQFPQAGEAPQLEGSVMSVVADTKEQVRELLSKDIYAREGVWDVENAEIYAVSFLCGSCWCNELEHCNKTT